MPITIKVQGLKEATETLSGLMPHLTKRTILDLSQFAFDRVQEGAGRHNKTGALFRSTYNEQIPDGRRVGHNTRLAPHALFVNLGTKPHIIRPKNKKSLRWAVGGKFFFAGKVQHPGYIGDPYVIKAADASVREFARILDNQFRSAP